VFGHNSGKSGAILTKLGTHIALCMYKNLMYVLYKYLSPMHEFPKRIWIIHAVEEIKLWLLLGNGLVMTSRLATVGQAYPRKHIVSAKMYNVCACACVCVCVCPGITLESLERFRPNLVHMLLYVCVRILCMFYIYI
jgi:hypothetical protein